MGPCMSSGSEEDKKSKQIEAMMRRENKLDQEVIKLLLLGAGESGKSTLFKQMKFNYAKEQVNEKSNRAAYVAVVHNNVIDNMQRIVKGARDISPCTNKELEEEVLAMDTKSTAINSETAATLKACWEDPGIVDTWHNRSTIQVQDALEYYMAKIDEIGSASYEPNEQDILRTRVRTSGIVEEEFNVLGTRISMYDVGGQRSERRKWMHKFEDVTAIIYVVGISEYDQLVFEDNQTNRQEESLNLFKKVFDSEFFKHLSFILFMNKADLFREKLPEFPFRVTEGEYARNVDFEGPYCEQDEAHGTPGTPEFEECVESAQEYLKGLYNAVNVRNRPLYIQVTTATDKENIVNVMKFVRDMVLRENLQKTGFYAQGSESNMI